VLDIGSAEFRDPKVFWYAPEQKWVMVVSLATEHKVRLYSSPDLKRWTQLSEFGPAAATGGVWECPDLFDLPVNGNSTNMRWVLVVNLNPGGVAGGSGAQYFVGRFDGTRFTADETTPPTADPAAAGVRWADYRKDFYAAVSWSDVPRTDGRRVWVGWMNNWQYGNEIPTAPWRSAQSLPRTLALKTGAEGIRLVQEPVAEFEVGTAEAGTASEFGLKVRTGDGEETVIGIDPKAGQLIVDRTRSGQTGFHKEFGGRQTAPLLVEHGRVRLRIFVDWSSVEVFSGDGQVVITDQIFPAPESDGVALVRHGRHRAARLARGLAARLGLDGRTVAEWGQGGPVDGGA